MTEDDLAAEADRLRTIWWDSIRAGGHASEEDAFDAYNAAYWAWQGAKEARTRFLLHASGETEP